MSIDFPKVIYIYVIILIVMYVGIIKGNVVKDVSSFTNRQAKENESVVLDTDYNGEKYSEDYLRNFIKNINTMKSETLATFFDEEYYKSYASDIKTALSSKARIRNTNSNTSYIEFVGEEVNSKNEKVYVYNILVIKKNMDYIDGFNALIEEDSLDKNKSIDIHVVEKKPYSYSLEIPEKEFLS